MDGARGLSANSDSCAGATHGGRDFSPIHAELDLSFAKCQRHASIDVVGSAFNNHRLENAAREGPADVCIRIRPSCFYGHAALLHSIEGSER